MHVWIISMLSTLEMRATSELIWEGTIVLLTVLQASHKVSACLFCFTFKFLWPVDIACLPQFAVIHIWLLQVVSTLFPVILRPNKGKPSDKTDSNHPIIKTLVWFMMDHHTELFNVSSYYSTWLDIMSLTLEFY